MVLRNLVWRKYMLKPLEFIDTESDQEPKPDIAICSNCGWKGCSSKCGTDQEGDCGSGYYGEGNINNKVIHVRSIVDGNQIVFKTWFKHKKMWSYQINHLYYFEFLIKNNHINEA
jgi:hypothetical protein